MEAQSPRAVAEQALEIWEANAEIWDDAMKDEGNDYWTALELPALREMAQVREGDVALDLATGNGLVARWLAEEGATVLATDGSAAMIEHATKRTARWFDLRGDRHADKVKFELLNLSDPTQVRRFVERRQQESKAAVFDLITMNMAIMDIPDLLPLVGIVSRLLKPRDGRFVATILHPLFFTSGAVRQIEISEDSGGNRVIERSLKVRAYLDVPPRKIVPFRSDQPARQIAFHRPLHELLSPFFAAGLVLDRIAEPNFNESFVDDARPHGSKSYTQFPKVLAFRLRRL